MFALLRTSAFSVLILLVAFSLLSCSEDPLEPEPGFDFRAEGPFSFDINITTQTHMSMENLNGTEQVTGSPERVQVQVEGTKIVESRISQEDAEAHLEEITIWHSPDDETIAMRSEHPIDDPNRAYQVEYEILVPDTWLLEVENDNGMVSLNSLRGASSANVSNGEIVLADFEADLDATVSNGQIRGDVALVPAGHCLLDVDNGQIDIDIPADTSAEFAARWGNGSFSLHDDIDLNNANYQDNEVTGVLGAGNGVVDLEVANGTIYVGVQ